MRGPKLVLERRELGDRLPFATRKARLVELFKRTSALRQQLSSFAFGIT